MIVKETSCDNVKNTDRTRQYQYQVFALKVPY